MACFAANSLLCRAALGRGLLDPATFTAVRFVSGALALGLLARARPVRPPAERDLPSAAALVVYAFAFSLAYVRIPAGLGALLLFGAVQVTMFGRAITSGERVAGAEWGGLALSTAGLVALTFPGLSHGDLPGSALMLVAGVAWGAYSLRGRRAPGGPLLANARAFALVAPAALAASAAAALLGTARLTPAGLGLAAAAGVLATGAGYAIWFAALEGLTATRAALVQLSVPPLAAFGGVLLLGEPVTLRLVLSAAAILSGIAVATVSGRR